MSKVCVRTVIDDGYTIPTRIREHKPRSGELSLHGELLFSRRPSPPSMAAKFIDSTAKMNELQTMKYGAEVVAKMVTQWDAVDEKGDPLPIDTESILLLPRPVQLRLMNIICYATDGGDELRDEDVPPPADSDLLEELRKNLPKPCDSSTSSQVSPG